MKRLLLIILSVAFLSPALRAQETTVRYNSGADQMDIAADMESRDGNYYVGGSSFNADGNWDMVTVKMDVQGDTLWTRPYDLGWDEQLVSIEVDDNFNIYAVGTAFNPAQSRATIIVVSYDHDGNINWETTYNLTALSNDVAADVVFMPTGELAIAHNSVDENGEVGLGVTALNAGNGSVVWFDLYNGGTAVYPHAISASPAGVAIAGRFIGTIHNDGLLLTYNPAGQRAAEVVYDAGFDSDEVFYAVALHESGDVAVGGWEYPNATESNFYVARYGFDGTPQYDYRFATGVPGMHRAVDVGFDADGKILATGRAILGGGSDQNVFTVKLADDGSLDWSQMYSGPGTDGDTFAPVFAGAMAAWSPFPGIGVVAWMPALDDVSMDDEIEYHVFRSDDPNNFDFTTPEAVVEGELSVLLNDLLPGTTEYFIVRAVDRDGNMESNSRVVSIDLGSPLQITTTVLPDATVGTNYNETFEAQGGTQPYMWDITAGALPNGMNLASNGILDGTPTEDGVFNITVRVTDSNNDEASEDFTISVLPDALAITTNSLPDGTVGTPYDEMFEAAGGVQPYTWDVSAGSLPDGLMLNGDGTLDGTPTLAGSFQFTVRVTDDVAGEATRDFTLDILPDVLQITTDALPNAVIATAYSAMLEASGGIPPYTWSVDSGSLPDGIDLNADGTITGSSDQIGSYQFTAKVTDNSSTEATKQFTLDVTPPGALVVDQDMTLPGGKHWFSSVVVRPGATLTVLGDATICATDSIIVEGAIMADCHSLTFNEYKYIILDEGLVDNRCADGSGAGGDLKFESHGASFDLQATDSVGTGFATDGDLWFSTDSTFETWEMAIPNYAVSGAKMDPVGYISADALNTIATAEEPANIEFELAGGDPDGGHVTFDVDFGDGETMTDIPTRDGLNAFVEKEYTTAGTYTVTLTINDDDGASSTATAQVHIGDSLSSGDDGLGLAPISDITVAVGDTLYLASDAVPGAAAEIATVNWDFGDTQNSTEFDPQHVYAAAGRYEVTIQATDDSGNAANASFSVYAYDIDTSAFAGGSINAPAPANPQIIPSPLNAPFRFGRRGWFPFSNPDVTVNGPWNGGPNMGMLLVIPPPMARDGRNGHNGWGMLLRGRVVNLNGAIMRAQNGGNGGRNDPGRKRAGKGGNGGSLRIRGKNVNVSGYYAAGDGGEGGSADVTVAASGTARAIGRRGGNAGKKVSFRGTKSLNFTGPTTVHLGNGGKGGDATATGGDGMDRCKTGQDGANAYARAGKGGRASKRGTVRGNPGGLNNITLSGGQAGNGGNADALGGNGGNALNCKNFAEGGEGGYAVAYGGKGGQGGYRGRAFFGAALFKAGDGGEAIATAGFGGDAKAIPDPQKAPAGCPGDAGVDVTANGGDGGNTIAQAGRKGRKVGAGIDGTGGNATAEGSLGGDADALAGDGGDGTGCNCDGGPGGKATARGGDRGSFTARAYDGGTETEDEGFDGDAVATGGNGGKGGECCTPPAASGGSGGAGGDAVATAGMNGGTAIANGGSGGAGGDGCGPGGGGNGGGASATGESEVENPGPNGAPGAWCVPPPEEYYIWFDDIVPGPISEGTQTIPVYDNPTGTGTPVGEVTVFFGGPLNKQPTGGIQMQAGAIIGVDWKTFVRFGPPDLTWPNFKVNSVVADIINGTDFPQCFIMRGFYDTNLIDEALCQNPGGIGSSETVSIDVSGSSLTDTFDILEMNATAAILLQPALCFEISPDC